MSWIIDLFFLALAIAGYELTFRSVRKQLIAKDERIASLKEANKALNAMIERMQRNHGRFS